MASNFSPALLDKILQQDQDLEKLNSEMEEANKIVTEQKSALLKSAVDLEDIKVQNTAFSLLKPKLEAVEKELSEYKTSVKQQVRALLELREFMHLREEELGELDTASAVGDALGTIAKGCKTLASSLSTATDNLAMERFEESCASTCPCSLV